eukprot:TRINITY_DN12416_c0_g1_i1.p1 TRINITY_DN12416_c0_g1~~TRINITY_DN12416_c0_g1_i1.p1  ORF type:complete len:310 (+),score=41.61 TRINITY_DN12416_c0_g1_i1:136-1065(+)
MNYVRELEEYLDQMDRPDDSSLVAQMEAAVAPWYNAGHDAAAAGHDAVATGHDAAATGHDAAARHDDVLDEKLQEMLQLVDSIRRMIGPASHNLLSKLLHSHKKTTEMLISECHWHWLVRNGVDIRFINATDVDLHMEPAGGSGRETALMDDKGFDQEVKYVSESKIAKNATQQLLVSCRLPMVLHNGFLMLNIRVVSVVQQRNSQTGAPEPKHMLIRAFPDVKLRFRASSQAITCLRDAKLEIPSKDANYNDLRIEVTVMSGTHDLEGLRERSEGCRYRRIFNAEASCLRKIQDDAKKRKRDEPSAAE